MFEARTTPDGVPRFSSKLIRRVTTGNSVYKEPEATPNAVSSFIIREVMLTVPEYGRLEETPVAFSRALSLESTEAEAAYGTEKEPPVALSSPLTRVDMELVLASNVSTRASIEGDEVAPQIIPVEVSSVPSLVD
jgi:hypothetical protein